MVTAFPVEGDQGEESVIFGHFAVAPGFIISRDGKLSYIENADGKAQGGGSRNVSEILAENGVEAVVASGIGMGAIRRLNSLGIKVYSSMSGMVQYELKLLESGKLSEMTEGHCDGSYR